MRQEKSAESTMKGWVRDVKDLEGRHLVKNRKPSGTRLSHLLFL